PSVLPYSHLTPCLSLTIHLPLTLHSSSSLSSLPSFLTLSVTSSLSNPSLNPLSLSLSPPHPIPHSIPPSLPPHSSLTPYPYPSLYPDAAHPFETILAIIIIDDNRWSLLIDDCGVRNLTEPATMVLRHWLPGADGVVAHWNFDHLAGNGGWLEEGCQITHTEINITTVSCHHFSNIAVLKKISSVPDPPEVNKEVLHPVIYTCTAVLLLCLFTTIITYILKHK
uniref:GAIN-B domain-containing protein n=1 Tax=Callorhinchus milii TaxID=7868 RepID=A0A4W3GLB6_CALMI